MPGILPSRFAKALGLLLALLLLAPALRAGEEAARPVSTVQLFEALRVRVEAAVTAGQLPAEVTRAAVEGLAFDLERELIRRDAEIQVGRLEAARYTGEPQQRALDRLIAAVAARELTVVGQIRRLEELSGLPAGPLPIAGAPADGAPADGTAPAAAETIGAVPEPDGEQEPEGKDRGLSLSFEAEDPIEDPTP